MHIFPNSLGGSDSTGSRMSDLREAWSPAARAAAIAARGHKGQGTAQRKAVARAVFHAAGGKRSQKAAEREGKRHMDKFKAQHEAHKKSQATATKNYQKRLAHELATSLAGSKKTNPVEKVKVGGSMNRGAVKIVRRSSVTGKGKSRTYTPTSASRARLERTLGSKAQGYYFKGAAANSRSMMGRSEHRAPTSTGFYSYSQAQKERRRKKKG